LQQCSWKAQRGQLPLGSKTRLQTAPQFEQRARVMVYHSRCARSDLFLVGVIFWWTLVFLFGASASM
jgi:hypothetical protein